MSSSPAFTAPSAVAHVGRSAFVGRTQVVSGHPCAESRRNATTTRAQFKMPSFDKLPKLPKLPGKGDAPPASAESSSAKVSVPSVESSKQAPSLSSEPSVFRSMQGAPKEGTSVKFYNSKTQRYVFKADAKGHGATAFDNRVGGPDAGANARSNENGTFRNMDPYTENPVWARPGWSPAEASTATRAVLRQVLGNAHLVEEEVEELAAEISCFKKTGETKEFVRAVALSDAYKSRFFEGMTNMRFVELNFKHFLGRAPRTQAEISEHIQIIVNEGYNDEINSYLDCDEYDTLWGDERVPQPNFRGGHDYNKDMKLLAVLQGGNARSDRFSASAVFASGDVASANSVSIRKGLPAAWQVENDARIAADPVRAFPSTAFWNPKAEDVRQGDIEWQSKYGVLSTNWYKDSIVFKEVMSPALDHSEEEVALADATLKWGATMAKNYVGVRYQWSTAPVISIKVPSSDEAANGQVNIAMEEIEFAVPSDLTQKV